jgi:hypothetical protein
MGWTCAIVAGAGLLVLLVIGIAISCSAKRRARVFQQLIERRLLVFDRVLIDTNIWMNSRYHGSVRLLAKLAKHRERPLRLLGPEFEEIVRLKSDHDASRAKDARDALRLIEELQTAGLILSDRMAPVHIRRAFFDGAILPILEQELKNGRCVAIPTDDRELRVRLRGRYSENGGDRVAVVGGEELGLDVERDNFFAETFMGLLKSEREVQKPPTAVPIKLE